MLELLKRSAIDHFLVGDFEMAAGMMEMLLDMDPEDHLETTKPLAFCYLALEDYELSTKSSTTSATNIRKRDPEALERIPADGQPPAGELIHFKKVFRYFTPSSRRTSTK